MSVEDRVRTLEKMVAEILQALSDHATASDSANQVLRNELPKGTATFKPASEAPRPEEPARFNLDKVNWGEPIQREGKEPFQKAIPQANAGNADFAALTQWLTTKPEGKAFAGNSYLIKFQDGAIGKFPTHKRGNN